MLNYLKYLTFLLAAKMLYWLPVPVGYRMVAWAADVAFWLRPRARHAVMDNVRHVMGPQASVGQIRRTAREAFRNVGRYYFDLIRTPHLDPRRLMATRVTLHGYEHLAAAMAAGKGVIIASAHFGNVEMVVQAAVALNVHILTLTEPLNPPALAQLIGGLRRSLGQGFLPVNRANIKTAVRTLKRGGVVGITCDRDVQGTGISIPFCGSEAYMPTGVVDLAMRTGAAVVPVFAHRRPGGRVEAFVHPPLEMAGNVNSAEDVRRNLACLLTYLEEHLRQTPGQWMVMEPLWRERPPRSLNGGRSTPLLAKIGGGRHATR